MVVFRNTNQKSKKLFAQISPNFNYIDFTRRKMIENASNSLPDYYFALQENFNCQQGCRVQIKNMIRPTEVNSWVRYSISKSAGPTTKDRTKKLYELLLSCHNHTDTVYIYMSNCCNKKQKRTEKQNLISKNESDFGTI